MIGYFNKIAKLKAELETAQSKLDIAKDEIESMKYIAQKEIEHQREEDAALLARAKKDMEIRFREQEQELKHTLKFKSDELRLEHAEHLKTVEIKHAEEVANREKEYYSRMQDQLQKLHMEGDKNTQFVQQLALGMVAKTPDVGVRVSHVQIEGEGEDK